MKKIVITSPGSITDEARRITNLLVTDTWRVHIRKPDWTAQQIRDLIESIPVELRQRLSLHDHHELAGSLHVGGIHLNRRNPVPPAHFNGILSRSCHSINEVSDFKAQLSYVFLSPIFDSISKNGYHASFSDDSLASAAACGIIDSKVIALGGIDDRNAKTMAKLKEWHFGGYAELGAVWNL